jgi:hypothetical protein
MKLNELVWIITFFFVTQKCLISRNNPNSLSSTVIQMEYWIFEMQRNQTITFRQSHAISRKPIILYWAASFAHFVILLVAGWLNGQCRLFSLPYNWVIFQTQPSRTQIHAKLICVNHTRKKFYLDNQTKVKFYKLMEVRLLISVI